MNNPITISYALLFAIVFASGFFSGVINYLMHNLSNKWNFSAFVNCVLYGIFFSAVVMFFLQLFVTTVSSDPNDTKFIHVVFAFVCFIGAVFLYLALQLLLGKLGKTNRRA